MSEYKFLEYETLHEGAIARITLQRPEARNAQNRGMLVELDEAFRVAEKDDAVRVVILRGAGPTFSAGHDLGPLGREERDPGPGQHPTYTFDGGTRSGAERRFLQEWHYFYRNTLRWRDLRKITIAEVQGTVFSAGLMLMWACDLIVGAEGTEFADVVGTRMGMCGVEYFAHPWELGARRTKELMLTGDSISIDEAHRIGMVSKVFPAEDVSDKTVAFALRISRLTTMAAMLIKESVNQTLDNMGFTNSLNAAFSLHQLNHSHWAELNGGYPAGTPESGLPDWRNAPPISLARRDVP